MIAVDLLWVLSFLLPVWFFQLLQLHFSGIGIAVLATCCCQLPLFVYLFIYLLSECTLEQTYSLLMGALQKENCN